MNGANELRQRAERYRRLRMQVSDPAATRAICEVAGQLDMTAEQLERQRNIRERAHEIWIEHGRPEGRNVEFWLAAEREVDIQRRR
jgi:transcription initiation factor TFIIIB Brf1 subunit/transcription initiation factor TFIIB